jgi:glycerol-1-phosphate dehydrogenase [NAD(P)+]
MELPRRILIGDGVIDELRNFINDSGIKLHVVVAAGVNVQNKVRERVASVLDSIKWIDVKSSDVNNVKLVMKESSKTSCIVGLGGGKSVDVAKLAAFRSKLPFFSVPTSASHDGISSPFASIKGTRRHYSFKAKPPTGILADVGIIADAPQKLHAAGCGDLISKLTAVKDWRLAHEVTGEYYGAYAASLALMSATVVLEGYRRIGLYSKEAIRDLVEALIATGVAAGIAGSSRPCSGAEHLFSHYLDVIAPGTGLHGEKCGIGTILMAKLHDLEWEKIRRALKEVHAPTCASDIGLSDIQVINALVNAKSIRPDRYTILSKVKMNERQARELATSTHVI